MTNASKPTQRTNERTMQQWHPRFVALLSLLHYHLLHFTVLRVPIGCLRGQISILHILQISVTFFRYRLHFSDIGYIFQISVMILICIATGELGWCWVGCACGFDPLPSQYSHPHFSTQIPNSQFSILNSQFSILNSQFSNFFQITFNYPSLPESASYRFRILSEGFNSYRF